MSLRVGNLVEAYVKRWLELRGARFVAKNYRTKVGEIDLIMWDTEYLSFIEVRYRKNILYGKAIESVTKSKQLKIIKSANIYLRQNKLYDKYPIRFDIVTVEGKFFNDIEWIKGAFILDY